MKINHLSIVQLQKDLTELGFKIVGKLDGKYGTHTQWAIREFQIYAKMSYVAQEKMKTNATYIDRLISVKNTRPYTGPISGLANKETAELIQFWKSKQWRCPVIINAYKRVNDTLIPQHENIWLHNAVTDSSLDVYAHDYTQYYANQDSDNKINASPILLGNYIAYGKWGGPQSPITSANPISEMSSENFLGLPYEQITPEQRSLYKVIRAVANVECYGLFDCINAYDNAIISLGPFHWTLGILSPNSEGELCAFLSYLRYKNPKSYQHAFANFGVTIDKNWINDFGVANGSKLFNASQRKYTAWLALQQDDEKFYRIPISEKEANYFRTWHWFYRFVMAARSNEGFRKQMWNMACLRIRDLLLTPYPENFPIPYIFNASNESVRTATIGDIYTSEKAVAMLVRWHVRYPGDVVNNGKVGKRLLNAFSDAGIPHSAKSPKQWSSKCEQRLIDALLHQIDLRGNKILSESIRTVANFPISSEARNMSDHLSASRNSFRYQIMNIDGSNERNN